MRKFFIVLFLGLFFACAVKAEEVDILPTMYSKTNIQDRAWSGAFQIVWNDMMDKYAYGSIRFATVSPDILKELNAQTFDSYEHPKSGYYTHFGKLKYNTVSKISHIVRKKYKMQESNLLSQIDISSPYGSLILYAISNEDIVFQHKFDDLGFSEFRNKTVSFFGITTNSDVL